MKNKYVKKRNAVFGRYPCCDLINNAIRFIFSGKIDLAIDSLFRAVIIADGYIHQDLDQVVIEAHNRVVDKKE